MNDSVPAFVPATPPLVVRASDVADMAQVSALYAREVQTGTASFDETAPSLEDMLVRRAGVLARGCPYLVAVRGDQVVGFAYAGPFHTRSAFRYTVENTVYVAPDAARTGVARALMDEVIARCSASGFRQMIAVIGGDNPASVAFHEAIGFRTVGRLEKVGFKFGRWLDTTTMQRPLGEPGHTDQK